MKDMTLDDKNTYQQQLAKSLFFKHLYVLHTSDNVCKWLKHMLFIEGSETINELCQYLNLQIYEVMSETDNSYIGKGNYHIALMKYTQSAKINTFKELFRKYLSYIYNESFEFNMFMTLVLNWMYNMFITEWVAKTLKMMRDQIRVSIGCTDATLIE